MCGIFGYFGNERAAPILLRGLKNLEYRGYDSAGIATLDDGKIVIKKDVGKIDEIHKKHDLEDLPGKIGIAHTRWATHGGVTKENAHPHLSNNRKIAVVHNGIIENFQEIKNFLRKNNFFFYSETDTEVIPNLIEFEMKNGKSFEEACKDAFKQLEGNYAVLVINADEEKIVGARSSAPLLIGVGKGCFFPSSDIPSFLEFTKSVIYLHEKDMFVIDDAGVRVFNLIENKELKRPVDTVAWDIQEVKKGEFQHFMLKEIFEQSEVIKKAAEQDPEILLKMASFIKVADKVFFVACGSSYHACLAASYLFSKIAKIHVDVVLASEFLNFKDLLTDKSLVVAVSQSGETADVLEAVRHAKGLGCKVLSITNNIGSSLYRESDCSLLMNAGPEICVVATKTYTSQLSLLALLAYTLAGKFEEGKNCLKYLSGIVYNLTAASTREVIKSLAGRLKNVEHLLLIGRGLGYPTALEAALKIKEVSYIHAEAFAAGELKHGTIALVEKGLPCIVFISKENERETVSNAIEVKARGGYIIGVSSRRDENFDFWIKVPECDSLNPIVQIIPIQILAYQLAILRGCDPDKPRNLAKSVTVK